MEKEISTQRWHENAQTWTALTRAGFDVYRDVLNTPWFLRFLPDVRGQYGIDIGCGEGTNTRHVAQLGATMMGCDLVQSFVDAAQELEAHDPVGASFSQADARNLPFQDNQFDFATSFMCLMDFPKADQALKEAFRVIKPLGFLQFSILHPCFVTLNSRKDQDPITGKLGRTIHEYFTHSDGAEETWTFGTLPPELLQTVPKFNVPRFHRPLSDWLKDIITAGFTLEAVQEPRATAQEARDHPTVADTQDTPLFLHFRCRKPE